MAPPTSRSKECSHEITSNLLAAPSQHAVAFRLTADLKRQLLQAHKAGEVVQLQLSTSSAGASLRVGKQTIQLNSKPIHDTEAIIIPSDGSTIQSAVVGCKLAPAPNRQVKQGSSLAAKARQLSSHPEICNPSVAKDLQVAVPASSGRLTAPKRSSLAVRQPKKQEGSSQINPVARPVVDSSQIQPSTGKAATAEELHRAFSSGGLKLLLAAVLCERPLPKGALTKKLEDTCRAAGAKSLSFRADIQPELRHVAVFRSPGVYALLPGPRKDFEAFRRLPQVQKAQHTKTAKPAQPNKEPRLQSSRRGRPANRDWTKELLDSSKGVASKALHAKKKVSASNKQLLSAEPLPKSRFQPPNNKTQMSASVTHKRKPELLHAQAPPGTPSFDSNATYVAGAASSPEAEIAIKHCLDPKDFAAEHAHVKRAEDDSAEPPAKRPRKTSTKVDVDADDSWYHAYVSREPQVLAEISSREQFEEVASEYSSKYAVYFRLHLEIQEANRLCDLFSAPPSSSSEHEM
eukprot:scaffold275922_cov41-Prasinocladus_malaysianus.AAC.1